MQRKKAIEHVVESQPVRLVLHERRREPFTQHLALKSQNAHRFHCVERLRHGNINPRTTQRIDEGEDMRFQGRAVRLLRGARRAGGKRTNLAFYRAQIVRVLQDEIQGLANDASIELLDAKQA